MTKWLTHLTVMAAVTLGYLSGPVQESVNYSPLIKPEPQQVMDSPAGSMIDFHAVRLLYCGNSSGTAVVIGNGLILTAAHVTAGKTVCVDDRTGAIGTVSSRDPAGDISLVTFEPDTFPADHVMEISCDGFQRGETYFAVGWEHGTDLVVNRMIGMGIFEDVSTKEGSNYPRLAVLLGRIIPGMSGGPIVDRDGHMVGMNNVTDHVTKGYSREMRDTSLCPTN